MKAILAAAVVAFLLADVKPASAQIVARWYRMPGGAAGYGARWTPWGWRPYAYYGYGYGYGYGYPGRTPYGDYARGMSQVIRARGLAAESQARARLSHEQARSQYIENQQKWLETYHERKRLGEAARQARAEQRRDETQRYLAHQAANPPPGLTLSDVNPVTGKVDWPEALQAPHFADFRNELDSLFAARAEAETFEGNRRIYNTARAMQSRLKDEIRDVPTDQYIAARKFLDRMVRESRTAARG